MNVQIISGFLVLFSFIFGQTQFLRQDLFAIEDISIRKRSTMLVFNYFSVLISVEFYFWFLVYFLRVHYIIRIIRAKLPATTLQHFVFKSGSLIHPPLDNQSSFSFQTTRVAGLFVHNKGFGMCMSNCLFKNMHF